MLLNLRRVARGPTLALVLAAFMAIPCPAQKPAETAAPDVPSKSETKRAEQLLNRALRLQADRPSENLTAAAEALHEASALSPADATIATAEEVVKQQLAAEHIERGNRLMVQNRTLEARSEFRTALMLDPANAYAQQRLADAAPPLQMEKPLHLEALDYASEPVLAPAEGAKTLDYKGDTRGLFNDIGRTFGVEMIFDPSFQARPVKFRLDNVDFFRAMNVAVQMSKAFYVVGTSKHILVAADTPDNRKKLQRLSLRTFRVSGSTSPQELIEVQNVLRTMLNLPFIAVSPGSNTIIIRAPQQTMEAAERLINDLGEPKPQVMLEVHVVQVDHTAMRNIGVNLPLQFTMFNINTEARALLQNSSGLTGVLAQLAAGANLSPSDLAAAAALLAAQQAGGSSPILHPFATFRGGITREGVNIPPASAHLEFNSSSFRSLQQV